MISVDDYNKECDCMYKNDHYSVRDNGAIKRRSRKGMRLRKYDDRWTFGKKNPNTGYMEISGERVHRIVAYAFHGEPPTDEYVVDHIDTNRCNNRLENLRWLTRLENALNNDITRAKIIIVCGSLDAFIENPSILNGKEKVNKNFAWMRTVTSDEAKIAYENIKKWSENSKQPQGKQIDEWIFTERKPKLSYSQPIDKTLIKVKENEYVDENDNESVKQSATPNAIQVDWKVISEFPLCPQVIGDDPLYDYHLNLRKDSIFCQNSTYSSKVVDSVLIKQNAMLVVMTYSVFKSPKPWAIAKITYTNDGNFIHTNEGSFFEEEGALKKYTLLQGKEWTGGDSKDDYC